MTKPILCLDFDGVIHSYTSGWHGATTIPDPVTPGTFEFIDAASEHFKIVVHSSRAAHENGANAILIYFAAERQRWRDAGGQSVATWPVEIEVVDKKPPAFVTIDDRALTFTGNWADFDIGKLMEFKPWNK